MEFINAIINSYRRYFQFSGRTSRKEYLYFLSFVFGLCIAFNIARGYFISQGIFPEVFASYEPIPVIILLLSVIPLYAAGFRRMHDVGKSGYFLFIPYYSIYLVLRNGDPEPNQYGDPVQ
jgi:uncharacterized membrane protein YhaH (DUF805 family)